MRFDELFLPALDERGEDRVWTSFFFLLVSLHMIEVLQKKRKNNVDRKEPIYLLHSDSYAIVDQNPTTHLQPLQRTKSHM